MNNKSYCIQKLFLIISISFSTLLAGYQVNLVQERGEEVSLRFSMSESDYEIQTINVNGKKCDLVLLPDAAYDEDKGFPHVPRVAQSMIIPDQPKMKLEIVDVQEKIEDFIELDDPVIDGGLVTVENVQVRLYRSENKKQSK